MVQAEPANFCEKSRVDFDVQEVIEEANHLYLFLLKFHCKLNFIEYFWGSQEVPMGKL